MGTNAKPNLKQVACMPPMVPYRECLNKLHTSTQKINSNSFKAYEIRKVNELRIS